MNPKRANRMIMNMAILCMLCAAMVIVNILYTMTTKQHFRSGVYVEAYARTKESTSTISANRGYIYDRNQEVIAQDIDTYTIYAILDSSRIAVGGEPAYVVDISDTADKIAPLLGMSVDEMLIYFETAQAGNVYQTEFGTKGKHLSAAVKESIEALELPGIAFTKTSERFYPIGNFASYLIGYAQFDEQEQRIVGKMGIESYLDTYLSGSDGEMRYQTSADGTILPGTKYVETQAVNGNDIYLTLDKNVQVALRKCLEDTMEAFSAQRAWGVIMEVETGRILAIDSAPTFDLNERNIEEYGNVLSEYLYEPGSVMKAFTYAAAIDSGNYPEDATFASGTFHIGIDTNGNAYRASTYQPSYGSISEALGKDFGTLTFDEGFMHSSNVAICELLTKYLPTDIFEDYLDRFGFFKKVGMEGLSEQAGVKNFTYPIEKLTTGFGQGSSVTALQIVQAYSALFNDGTMVKPYYIDKIINSYDGTIIQENTTEVAGQPITKETADKLKELMDLVVNNEAGSGYVRFHMDDVQVIGKTGTGEISANGTYDNTTYVNSFIAAAPAEDPKIMMYYVFESGDILYSNGDYFKAAFRQALIAEGISGTGETSQDSSDVHGKEYTMPNVINHSMAYTKEKLQSMQVNIITIGDGTYVLAQYPNEKESVVTNQNVFLLTDGSSVTMPNMIGWTRKDVQQFATMSNLTITVEGSGSVTTQSVQEGVILYSDSSIHVVLT